MPVANISAQYEVYWDIAQASQNIGANTSNVYGRLIVRKKSGSGYWSNNANGWDVNINGWTTSGTYTYDFRNYSELMLWQGNVDVGHNADGTKSIGSNGAASMSSPSGSARVYRDLGLSTIPRASEPTMGNPTTGSAITINMNRKSGSFTHTVRWGFGTQSGTIATGVTDNVSWTPGHSMFNQDSVKNTAQGTGTVWVDTYNGGSLVGTKSVGFTLTLAASQIPTLTGATFSEAVTSPVNIASVIGAYVQNQSKLNYTVNGGAGILGSTIADYEFVVGDLTTTGKTGVTGFIPNSGTVAVKARVKDSRGRWSNYWTQNITVLAWQAPQITNLNIQRSLNNGTLDPAGTYLKVVYTATVSTLLVSSAQKNTLTYKTDTSLAGANSWTNKRNTAAGAVATVNASYVISPYVETSSFDVRVQVLDRFATSTVQRSIPVAAVALDLGLTTVGIGKFWERGTLDVGGDIYSDGALMCPVGSLSIFAGATAPLGWMFPQGQALSRTTYAKLYAAIGTLYGAGDGSTTFLLPDLRGRVPVALNPSETEFDTLNEKGGAKTHTLGYREVPVQKGVRMTWGQGNISFSGDPQAMAAPPGGNGLGTWQNDARYDADAANNMSAGGQPHNNLQPYITMNYIIRVQ